MRFAHTAFEHAGQRHDVYRAGSGPGVVVIHEMPGIHPGVAARRWHILLSPRHRPAPVPERRDAA